MIAALPSGSCRSPSAPGRAGARAWRRRRAPPVRRTHCCHNCQMFVIYLTTMRHLGRALSSRLIF